MRQIAIIESLTSHCEDAHKETNAPSSQHDFLLRVITGCLLAGCPDANSQDQQVEDDNGYHPRNVNHCL